MKCPSCMSVCLETDPVCYSCRRPLVGRALSLSAAGPSYAIRMALVLMAFGACLGPVVCRAFFPGMSRELFDFNSLSFAGSGAALGAILGYALGSFVSEVDR